MNDRRFDALERFAPLVRPPTPSFESFLRRRDRKRRNQRIAAGIAGILVFVVPVAVVASLISLDRTPAPAAGQGSQEDAPANVDATITVTRSTCTVRGGDDPINAYSPALRFVNDARGFHAYFVVVELRDGKTVADLRRNPPYMEFEPRPSDWGAPSPKESRVTKGWVTPYHRTETWLSPRSVDPGVWAVVCWLDVAISSNGWSPKLVDVLGPLEVG